MARPRRAGRAAHPGDEALRRRRARDADAHAGLRDGPPRRGPLERRRDPVSRVGIEDVVTNFGDGPVRDSSAGATVAVSEDDFNPFDEARMVSAICGGVRVASACTRPTGAWWARRSSRASCAGSSGCRAGWPRRSRPASPLVLGGDYNVTPADIDVWSPAKAHGGTHVSEPEREALARLRAWGLVDTYRDAAARSRAGSRGGTTGPACSTATRACGSTCCTRRHRSPERVVWAEIDREARKGPPTPSDHAPVVIDLDEPGLAFDAGWYGRASSGSPRGRSRAPERSTAVRPRAAERSPTPLKPAGATTRSAVHVPAQRGDQHGLDRVHPVLGLVEHDRCSATRRPRR